MRTSSFSKELIPVKETCLWEPRCRWSSSQADEGAVLRLLPLTALPAPPVAPDLEMLQVETRQGCAGVAGRAARLPTRACAQD